MNWKPLWMPALSLIFLLSCQQQEEKKSSSPEKVEVKLSLCDTLANRNAQPGESETTGFDEAREVYYRFPSPDEMLSFIDYQHYHYNGDLLSSTSESGNYLDSKSQALNLGVYIADLAYITLFERYKESLAYFKVIHDLSDELRISSAFDPLIISRFESNLDDIDSLETLIDESITQITFYLEKEDKGKELAMISVGGFVEALYLAFSMVDNYQTDNVIVQRISDQKLVLDNIIKYICAGSGDANIAYAMDIITPIWQVYDGLEYTTASTSVSRKEGKLIVGGGSRLSVSNEEYEALKKAVFNARSRIIRNPEK